LIGTLLFTEIFHYEVLTITNFQFKVAMEEAAENELHLKNEILKMSETCSEKSKQIDKLQKEKDSIMASLKEKSDSVEQLSGQIQNLSLESSQKSDCIKDLDSKIKQLHAQDAKQSQEIDDLKGALAEKVSAYDILYKEYDEAMNVCDLLENQLKETEDKQTDLQSNVEQLHEAALAVDSEKEALILEKGELDQRYFTSIKTLMLVWIDKNYS